MKTKTIAPQGTRLLTESEVPQPGDIYQWDKRDIWRALESGQTELHGLPVATIRHRCGQDQLEFARHL